MTNLAATQPYIIDDADVPVLLEELYAFPALLAGIKAFLPPPVFEQLLAAPTQVHTIADFQVKVILPILNMIEQASITHLSTAGLAHLSPQQSYLFISNHRDIVLDSAFLNTSLHHRGFRTSQIAIGDNLMKHRMSELVFRLNKSFVVKRSGTAMELYRYSVQLSEYISHTVQSGSDSVWLAQREGRAKDGNDRTQAGVLKMLSLAAGETDLVTYFQSLNIVPVSISYEYNPCGLLKTREYLAKLEQPDYKKTFEEDLQHMLLGLKGQKGRVHFHFGTPLHQALEPLRSAPNAKKQLEALAAIIDRHIHLSYQLHPVNYIAHDLLHATNQWANHYSTQEFEQIKAFFEDQLAQLPTAQRQQGAAYLLGMYAYPLSNFLTAQQEQALILT
jgi:Acyltransferase